MDNKLYVGNLPYSFRDGDLEQTFSAFGAVQSAKVMMERDTGRSKGFGFVEMTTADACQAAISALHGMSVDGRSITVNLARPREEGRRPGGGSHEFRASNRPSVGYGQGGYGGGRY